MTYTKSFSSRFPGASGSKHSEKAKPLSAMRRGAVLFCCSGGSFLPMLQLGKQGVVHFAALLLGAAFGIGEMRREEVYERLLRGVGESALRIAPFAVILIEGAVLLAADEAVLRKGHAAALAEELPRRAEKGVDGDLEFA